MAKEALYYCRRFYPVWRWPVLMVWPHVYAGLQMSVRASESWYRNESPLLLCPPDAWTATMDTNVASREMKQLVRSALQREGYLDG